MDNFNQVHNCLTCHHKIDISKIGIFDKLETDLTVTYKNKYPTTAHIRIIHWLMFLPSEYASLTSCLFALIEMYVIVEEGATYSNISEQNDQFCIDFIPYEK